MTQDPKKAESDAAAQRPEVGRLEWAVAALGAVLVVGVLGTLVREALTYDDGPPVIVATVNGVDRTEGGHVVRFTARNHGARTAAEVVVVGRLKQGETVLEEAEVTLDYVARRSQREAGVIFQRDPKTATLEFAATSYRKP